MREPATRDSWKREPMPADAEKLDYSAEFSRGEIDQIALGLVPEAMEDKWFIYLEDGYLYFHRSWTGICVFRLKLDNVGDKFFVSEALLNPGLEFDDVSYQVKRVDYLIQSSLLRRKVAFPFPGETSGGALKSLFQHHVAGRGSQSKVGGFAWLLAPSAAVTGAWAARGGGNGRPDCRSDRRGCSG